MRKVILSIFTAMFLITAVCLDVSAAKKGGKISKEAVQQMSDDIDNLTKKIYARALLSPQDNETLIGIKIQLDNQMLVSSTTELAPLYYKAGNIYKLRDMKPEAIDCYKTVLENFRDTALAPKAQAALEELGMTITAPNLSEDEVTEDDI